MKIVGDFNQWVVTQTLFSKILGVSVPYVSKLIDNKTILRDEKTNILLIPSLKKYYENKYGVTGEIDGKEEFARLTKAKREIEEIKLSKLRGEVYDAAEVEDALANLIIVLRNNLLGLPNKLAAQLEGKSKNEIATALTEELTFLLNEIANFDLTKLTEEVEDDGQDG